MPRTIVFCCVFVGSFGIVTGCAQAQQRQTSRSRSSEPLPVGKLGEEQVENIGRRSDPYVARKSKRFSREG